MNALIDIGVNLTNKRFRNDLPAVIDRARAAGVDAQIITGTSVAGSAAALDLARAHALYSTAGVHPHDAKSFDADTLPTLARLAADPRVVAIGECGLDYNRDFSPRPEQRRAFAEQLDLAVELALPVFLHERDAHDDFIALLAPRLPELPGAVVHCFTGSAEALRRYLDLGCHIGITGWICDERRGLELRALVREIPPGRLLVETDAPFLTPRDLRPKPKGGRNEPAFLPHIARTIAECMGVGFDALCAQTTTNARALFSRLTA